MNELTPETIQQMVRDTSLDYPACFNDLCCHVKALAAEVERLRAENSKLREDAELLEQHLCFVKQHVHALRDAADERDLLQGDVTQLRATVGRLIGAFASVKSSNINSWMEYAAQQINRAAKAIGDPDRVIFENGELHIQKGTPCQS